MIPLKLTLKNFMSYGEERVTLDFSGMHVVCLSGDNGNGKSALLEAITYALWGETRVSGSQASGEDDLIRLGADEMEIAFDFLLNNSCYRVIRRRNRRTRNGDWQVFASEPNESWRSISGAGIRETKRILTNLLHMEYETFLNSAYIQQGRADEFTRNKPEARKRILSDILGLRRYDRLEEMAKERRNECDLLIRDIEGDIRHLEARLQEEHSYRQRLQERKLDLEALTQRIDEISNKLKECQAKRLELEKQAEILHEREVQLQQYERETNELVSQIARLEKEIERDSSLLNKRAVILSEYEQLCQYRERMKELEPVMQSLQSIQSEICRLENQLLLRRQETVSEYQRLTMLCTQAAERQNKIEGIEQELTEISSELASRESLEQQKQEFQSEMERTRQTISNYISALNQMKNEAKELEEVIELLRQPRSTCPVCESDISGARQSRVLARQEKKLADIRSRISETKRQGAALRNSLPSLEDKLSKIDSQLQKLAGLQERVRQLRRQQEELKTQNSAWKAWVDQARNLKETLDREEYGAAEREQLQALKQESEKITPIVHEYQEARKSAASFTERQVERLVVQLEEAERTYTQRQEILSQQKESLQQRQQRIREEQKRLEIQRQQFALLPQLQQEERLAQQQLSEFAKEKEQAQTEVARLQQALDDCEKCRGQLAQRRLERDKLARDKQAYTDLASAFGKRGIQAYIIDNALPEIQDEANRLLSRMTDNSLQVALRTVRQGRSTGQQIETLDIVITDNAGERPYEMFSGGEAFRVNFALRIALSRLLTRRAGASLQTLILDEGFGTQDVKGRDRLVEAIQSVKEEFALILVISHIEALKDAFPTRIEVIKTPVGSQINYLE
jgi:exonuclease SbcC